MSRFEEQDPNLSVTDYMVKYYLITCIFVVLAIWAIGTIVHVLGARLTILFLISLPFLQYYFLKQQSEQAPMKQFAMKHNYIYTPRAENMVDTPSSYLKMGHGQYRDNIITGTNALYSSHMYTFHSTIGENENTERITFTVLEIEYPGYLLNIIIDAGHHPFQITLPEHYKLELEGNFNSYFSLFIPRGYHLEALQILTPDVMEFIINKAKLLSIEFVNNKLFIYADKELDTNADIEYMYQFADTILTKLTPVISRLSYVKTGI
jgi:hypothetical protein